MIARQSRCTFPMKIYLIGTPSGLFAPTGHTHRAAHDPSGVTPKKKPPNGKEYSLALVRELLASLVIAFT
jgi:hypothetical protein